MADCHQCGSCALVWSQLDCQCRHGAKLISCDCTLYKRFKRRGIRFGIRLGSANKDTFEQHGDGSGWHQPPAANIANTTGKPSTALANVIRRRLNSSSS